MKVFNIKSCAIFLASILISLNAYSHSHNLKPYFDENVISPNLISNPALPGSKKYQKQVKYIIKLQQDPDLDEVQEAFDERHLKVAMLAQFVNKNLTEKKYPKLYHLLHRVHMTAGYASRRAKNYWNLKRPYVAIKKIQPLIAAHANPAYPSGHTTASYSLAHILSLIFPQQKQQFLLRAQEIAKHRVLVGMHFPQDLDGGRELALLVVGGLLQNDNFQKDFKAAIKETKNLD